jgi:hypothetical protein
LQLRPSHKSALRLAQEAVPFSFFCLFLSFLPRCHDTKLHNFFHHIYCLKVSTQNLQSHEPAEDVDQHSYDLAKMTEDDMIFEAIQSMDIDEPPHEIKPSINNVFRRKSFINTMWYLIESTWKASRGEATSANSG